VIDNNQLLAAILGADKVDTFKEVKLASMRLARVVREVIAADLDSKMPAQGKQSLGQLRRCRGRGARPNGETAIVVSASRRRVFTTSAAEGQTQTGESTPRVRPGSADRTSNATFFPRPSSSRRM
jgi:hypothetical protein